MQNFPRCPLFFPKEHFHCIFFSAGWAVPFHNARLHVCCLRKPWNLHLLSRPHISLKQNCCVLLCRFNHLAPIISLPLIISLQLRIISLPLTISSTVFYCCWNCTLASCVYREGYPAGKEKETSSAGSATRRSVKKELSASICSFILEILVFIVTNVDKGSLRKVTSLTTCNVTKVSDTSVSIVLRFSEVDRVLRNTRRRIKNSLYFTARTVTSCSVDIDNREIYMVKKSRLVGCALLCWLLTTNSCVFSLVLCVSEIALFPLLQAPGNLSLERYPRKEKKSSSAESAIRPLLTELIWGTTCSFTLEISVFTVTTVDEGLSTKVIILNTCNVTRVSDISVNIAIRFSEIK